MRIFGPIFDALNESGARYVVVGGVAVVLHGHIRLTRDLDLVVDLEPAAATATITALSQLGLVPKVPVAAAQFADPVARESWAEEKGMVVFSLYDPANPLRIVDLFVRPPLPFEDLFRRSLLVPIGHSTTRIASLADLIAMKRQAGRPQDLLDIEQLLLIADRLPPGPAP